MRRTTWLCSVVLPFGIAVYLSPAHARPPVPDPEPVPVEEVRSAKVAGDARTLFSRASASTTVLHTASFDAPGSCTQQGWTSVDMTAQAGVFFHIDDYAGLNASQFFPLEGAKSLWCGARPQATGPLCGYTALPGYGNSWRQGFCTKDCIPVSGDGVLDVTFMARFDSEPGYDHTSLEYTLDCAGDGGWTLIDGGLGVWEGVIPVGTITGGAYPIGTAGPVKVRFYFQSDSAWSDQDGLWNTNGAVHIDNLVAEGIPIENFEGEVVGATEADDWTACTPPGYGNHAGLVLGGTVLQEDPCVRNISCLWAFFVGSTYTYVCSSVNPDQLAVPRGNTRGQYIYNWLTSPDIPLTGTGNEITFEFDVYRDLPLDNLVFYNWSVRSIVNGCPGAWKKRTSVYYGGQKDWLRARQVVGDLINLSASHINVALWMRDMCEFWCGIYGLGICHTHAPLFDNVKVYRVDRQGPVWNVSEMRQFQDNFAADGTLTGTVRADISLNILPSSSPGIIPGDSAVVLVSDPNAGLATDPGVGGPAVYCYVAVWPQGQPGKSGAGLTDDPVRWPVAGTWTDAAGTAWTRLRLDVARTAGGAPVPDTYCIDLHDNLFTPGDTVCFFYGAKNTNGLETYAFGTDLRLQGDDRGEASANPGEFTCLPAGGYNRGGDILYVDGMDGRGSQPAFDAAFAALGIHGMVDRFDVRAPSSVLSNRPAGRVKNVANQVLVPYRKIIWDTGDLSVTLGDGSSNPEKTNDYGLLNTFLDGLNADGGVYLCGDDLADQLKTYTSVSATTFKTMNLPFVLTSSNHRVTHGISPVGTSTGGCFTTDPTFMIRGGCPLLNDFDVLTPSGTSAMEIAYGAPAGTNGAVLSNARVNGNGATAGVLLSGFSFVYIADNDLNGVSDRADHLHDVITWLGNVVGQATGASGAYRTTLSQNYPNPFNPRTAIAFSLNEPGAVRLAIYDVSGALVRELVNGDCDSGARTEVWDGRDARGVEVPSGVYFYRLQTVDRVLSRKMMLLK